MYEHECLYSSDESYIVLTTYTYTYITYVYRLSGYIKLLNLGLGQSVWIGSRNLFILILLKLKVSNCKFPC